MTYKVEEVTVFTKTFYKHDNVILFSSGIKCRIPRWYLILISGLVPRPFIKIIYA